MTDQERPWNEGIPENPTRGGQHVKYEVLVGDAVQLAYLFAAYGDDVADAGAGQVWKDADQYKHIPAETILGWREPIPKNCRFGNHPIDEVLDRGLVTFFSIKDGVRSDEEYACFACDRLDRIRSFAETGIIRTKLWSDASMRDHERNYIREHLGSTDDHDVRLVLMYSARLAETALAEEAAFGQEVQPEVATALQAIIEDNADDCMYIEDIATAFGGPHQFWYDRLIAQMTPVSQLARQWEREVWFGGHDRSQDPQFTEPYPGLEDSRQYLQKPKGHNTHFSTREDVLPPDSLQAFVIPAKYKGYSAKVDDLTYLSYSMCGRSIFQVERGDDMISIILDETSPTARGGIQGIRTRGETAIELLQRAIDDWKARKIDLQHSDGVGFGF